MTSSSRSDGGEARNLAVYRTPPPPDGWHGRNLVRLVDPAGLSMTWLSARHAGAVIVLETRERIEDAWQPLLRTADAHPAAHFVVRRDSGDLPLAAIGAPWTMSQRDPTSGSFACDIDGYGVTGWCESGALRMTAHMPGDEPGSLVFVVDRERTFTGGDIVIEEAVRTGSLDVRIRRRAGSPVESDLSASFPQER